MSREAGQEHPRAPLSARTLAQGGQRDRACLLGQLLAWRDRGEDMEHWTRDPDRLYEIPNPLLRASAS